MALSLNEIKEYEKIWVEARNNRPIDIFEGLSPNQMHYLLRDTFNENSPIQLNNKIDESTLDQIPIFRIAEEYLKIIQREKQIKLTPLGALQKKVICELYDKRFVLDDMIEKGITKVGREEDVVAIRSVRYTLEIAGLVKKRENKLSLTQKAIKILWTNDRQQLFKLFFQTFTEKFAWCCNDDYTDEPVGQFGWAFSIILLNKFGSKLETIEFYAQKYSQAFPSLLRCFKPEYYTTPEQRFASCYGVRTFERFLLWFGLVVADKEDKAFFRADNKYELTEILNKIFKIQ